jgi:membrane associated rhomboid family serine protease
MTLSLPPFTKAVTWLIGINTGVFLLGALFSAVHFPVVTSIQYYMQYCELVPSEVVQRGFIWQLLTYSFLHASFGHWFWNMIGLWMFGSAIEGAWGTRRFLELYFIGVIGAAITTVLPLVRPESSHSRRALRESTSTSTVRPTAAPKTSACICFCNV